MNTLTQTNKMKKALIAPLDWGLGHATRCIPIIRELQRRHCTVFLAGSGDSLVLLTKEFPGLTAFSLPAYAPRYPDRGSMVWTMCRQLPHFVKVISAEHRALKNILLREKIDLILSDNRYGCWSPKVPSVFITHQSHVLMPQRFGWLQNMVGKMIETMMDRFHTCWIPDVPGEQSLTGDLAGQRPTHAKAERKFIGWLSRFEQRVSREKRYDVVAIFSGPEPQRTCLENIVVPQLENSRWKYRIVRGLPSGQSSLQNEHAVNFLAADALQACIESAGLVIARSGYSTVMDMQALGQKVVFIPTPGQTEQEYLAKRLMDKRIAFSMPQDVFVLDTAVEQQKNFSGFRPLMPNTLLKEAIASALVL